MTHQIAEQIESLRVTYEAILNVLMARQSSASDFDDWENIALQSRELTRAANQIKALYKRNPD